MSKKRGDSTRRDRAYLLTIQNPVEDPDWDFLNQLVVGALRFAVWQLERAPSTGTVHFQAYAEFRKPIRVSVIERWGAVEPEKVSPLSFSEGLERYSWCQWIHVEERLSSREACRQYCSEATFKGKDKGKLDGPWEWGEWASAGQGHRADLEGAAKWLQGGGDLRGLAQRWPAVYVKYSGGLEKLKNLCAPRVFRRVQCFVLWGGTGVGKSKFVYSAFGFDNVHVVASTSPFWLGPYSDQPVLFFEEFDSSLNLKTLLRVLDGYPDNFPTKGGHAAAAWFYVILTGNSDFTLNWPPELKRRIGCSESRPQGNVYHCGPNGVGFPSLAELGVSKLIQYEPVEWTGFGSVLGSSGSGGGSVVSDDAGGGGVPPQSASVEAQILPSYALYDDGVVRDCTVCSDKSCILCKP